MKYDKDKWSEPEDAGFPSEYRRLMIDDLTSNHNLKNLTKLQVDSLLGVPSQKDSNAWYYTIDLEYSGIEPDYSKTLILYFNKDSVTESFKIKEWEK